MMVFFVSFYSAVDIYKQINLHRSEHIDTHTHKQPRENDGPQVVLFGIIHLINLIEQTLRSLAYFFLSFLLISLR